MGNTTKEENSSGYVMTAVYALTSVLTWPIRAIMPSTPVVPQAPPPPPVEAIFPHNIMRVQLRPRVNKKLEANQRLIAEIEEGVILRSVKGLPKLKIEEKPGALTLFEARKQLKSATLRQLAELKPKNDMNQQMNTFLESSLKRRRAAIEPDKADENDGWDDNRINAPVLHSKTLKL